MESMKLKASWSIKPVACAAMGGVLPNCILGRYTVALLVGTLCIGIDAFADCSHSQVQSIGTARDINSASILTIAAVVHKSDVQSEITVLDIISGTTNSIVPVGGAPAVSVQDESLPDPNMDLVVTTPTEMPDIIQVRDVFEGGLIADVAAVNTELSVNSTDDATAQDAVKEYPTAVTIEADIVGAVQESCDL